MEEAVKRIYDYSLEYIMGDSFSRYAKAIIQDRALPDVRDGLKPVQRRILYGMYKDGNTYDKPTKKSAKAVGNIMGYYHPHGDSSIYDALVRMSQWWKNNLCYVEMQGNNGSMDGDGAAAMRYTEARLTKVAGELLKDINKDTVLMSLNYDDTLLEPTVLPARFAPCKPQMKKSSFQMRSRTCNCFGVYKSLTAISHLFFQHRNVLGNLIILLLIATNL